MTKILDSAGLGASITAVQNDANLSSLSGINAPITATSHTIDVDDQNDTIEYLNAASIAVTLPAIASVSGSNIHTDDFKVTFKNIGAGVVTVTRGSTDTFDDGSTSIALAQYEYATIQTDSSLTKWNIINSNIDNATKTGTQTLTNKTIGSGYGGGTIISDTVKATTSGSSVEWTTIPSWAKRITVSWTAVSTSGTGSLILSVGHSGGYSYSGGGSSLTMNFVAGSTPTSGSSGSGGVFGMSPYNVAASDNYGTITLSLLDVSTDTWAGVGTSIDKTLAYLGVIQGTANLAGTLDRLKVTTTSTFDAGKVSILYE